MYRLLWFVACLVLLTGGTAYAQTTQTIVSNLDNASPGDNISGYSPVALSGGAFHTASQKFILGDSSAADKGWTVTEVTIHMRFDAGDTLSAPSVAVCDTDSECVPFQLASRSGTGGRDMTYRHAGVGVSSGANVRLKPADAMSRAAVFLRRAGDASESTRLAGSSIHDYVNVVSNSHGSAERRPPLRIKIRGREGRPVIPPKGPDPATISSTKFTSSPQRWRIPSSGAAVRDVYGAGDQLTYVVEYNKAVAVSGTPGLKIHVGDAERTAQFVSIDGTDKLLTFAYTVRSSDAQDDNGPHVAAGDLNGGRITTGSNDGELSFRVAAGRGHRAVAASEAHKIDPSRSGPWVDRLAVTSMPGQPGNFYGYKDTIEITLTMGSLVSVSGQPSALFRMGSRSTNLRRARYASGSGTTMLVFTYTVVKTDLDEDGLYLIGPKDNVTSGTGGIELVGGSIDRGNVDLIHREGGTQTGHKVNGTLNVPPPPGKVTMLTAARELDGEALDGALRITWEDPPRNARLDFHGFEYRVAPTEFIDGVTWISAGITYADRATFTCPCWAHATNLTYGKEHIVEVRALSAEGPGEIGQAKETPQASKQPSAVRNLWAETSGGTGITVRWDPPESPGWLSVRHYEYRWTGAQAPEAWAQLPNDTTDLSFLDLEPERAYTIEVRASNDHGAGPVSSATAMIDTTPPRITRAEVGGDTLVMSYDSGLATVAPEGGSFAVRAGENVTTVTGTRVSGSRVLLTLNPAVMAGDRVTLDYTPGYNRIQDPVGNEAEALDDRPVTNRTGGNGLDLDPPAVVVEGGGTAGAIIVIDYNEPLGTGVQVPTRSFIVTSPPFRGVVRELQHVDVCGQKVVLTLARPLPFGFGALVAYVPGLEGQVQDRAGNVAAPLSGEILMWNEAIRDCNGRSPDITDPNDPADAGDGGGAVGGSPTAGAPGASESLLEAELFSTAAVATEGGPLVIRVRRSGGLAYAAYGYIGVTDSAVPEVTAASEGRSDGLGRHRLEFATGSTEATVTVIPAFDGERGAGRVITATLESVDVEIGGAVRAYELGPAALEFSVTDADAVLSVSDAWADAESAALVFRVRLDRPRDVPVRVDYATEDGTARAGEDYTAVSGTLEIAAGGRAATVTVPLLTASHLTGERLTGARTLVLRLSNARNARLENGTATGTIHNADPLLQAWLSRFGRTVGTHVVDAVGTRLRGAPGVESHVTVGGYRLPLKKNTAGEPAATTPGGASERALAAKLWGLLPGGTSPGAEPEGRLAALVTGLAGVLGVGRAPAGGADAAGSWADQPAGDPRLGQSQPLHVPALRQVLVGSSFRLHVSGDLRDSATPRLTAWGQFAGTTFDGRDGALTLGGDVLTGTLGVDGEWERWLAGVAVSHSRGDGSSTRAGTGGELENALTGVHPYLRYAVNERLDVWGVLGYGWGDVTLQPGPGATLETGTTLVMGAFGGRGLLLAAADTGGFQLATRTDAMLTRTTSDAVAGLQASEADAHRLRLVLEGTREVTWPEGRRLTPAVEIGLRHDWGDAETGFGLELGGRVHYADPRLGLTIEAAVRGLLAHEDSDYGEWGASGSLRLAPGPDGLGLAVTLSPTWGAAASGVEGLWSRPTTVGLALPGGPRSATGRVHAEVSYGITAFDTGLVTPYAGTVLAAGAARTYRVGTRLELTGGWTTGVRLSLEGQRQEPVGSQPINQGLQFQAAWGF